MIKAVYYTIGILYEVYYTKQQKIGILYKNSRVVYYTTEEIGILYRAIRWYIIQNGRKTEGGILYKENGCSFVQYVQENKIKFVQLVD